MTTKKETIKEALKKKYDGKSLIQIEKAADVLKDKTHEYRKDFILALHYLDFTSRFKDNSAFKNESFEKYITIQFGLSPYQYKREFWAFVTHEKASRKYSPSIIADIRKNCGVLRVIPVLDKIKKAEKARKAPLPIGKIKSIIADFTPPKEEKQKKPSYSYIEKQLSDTRFQNRNLQVRLAEANIQITRLKKTVMDYENVWRAWGGGVESNAIPSSITP